MKESDTIAAIATPIGVGGVGVVRISGEAAERVLKKVFRSKNEKYENRKMYFGVFCGKGFRDSCLAVLFRAPHSYTGEDVAEIHCHGGRTLVHAVLESVLAQGVRLADKGEFTKRAFLNGKLSLSESEGIIEMIHAESRAEINASYHLMTGELTRKVKEIQDGLTDLIASLEAALDYPEEEFDAVNTEREVRAADSRLQTLLQTYASGKLIKDGVGVVLAGAPNAGKSSLLNALLSYDRAIVTEIAGTTRDAISESVEIDGIRFRLTDTAGIRESRDPIEKLGVQRSRQAIAEADLILYVLDTDAQNDDSEEILPLLAEKKVIAVYNKNDRKDFKKKPPKQLRTEYEMQVSAKTGDGIGALKALMAEIVKRDLISQNGLILTNERHVNALERAERLLSGLLADPAATPDIAVMELTSAWQILGEITGTTASEEIVDAVFSKFCLGK